VKLASGKKQITFSLNESLKERQVILANYRDASSFCEDDKVGLFYNAPVMREVI